MQAKTIWYAQPHDVISNKLIASAIGGDESKENVIWVGKSMIKAWELPKKRVARAIAKNPTILASFFVSRNGREPVPVPRRDLRHS